jgi:hypothetical protein
MEAIGGVTRTWCLLTGDPLRGSCPCRVPCADSDFDFKEKDPQCDT